MKFNVHLICNAHLDPVWQWRWTEGCSEALMTFRSAADILVEYPELIFNHNEAILYQWVQQYDSNLFARIQKLVAEGRWFISGGWFLQPDMNLPPVENLVRNIRIGRDFFKEHFGAEPRVAYNFDSFGHPGTLPGILKEFGYEMYIHQRPEKEYLDLPDNLYQWKGLDGSTLATYRIEIGLYHNERSNIEQRLREGADLAVKLGRDVAVFWGIGDHGGGASRADMDKIRNYIPMDDRVNFLHSTTDRFYEGIRPLIPEAPVHEGSLQRIFTGCYTSLARVKRKALEASGAALQAEALTTEANSHTHESDCHPRESGDRNPLSDIWKDILFNDFHDILPGSCTEPAEQDALELYGRAMENIRRMNMHSITRINQSVPELKAYIPVTVFHSNSGLNTFPVEFECMSDYRPLWTGEWVLRLFDRNDCEIPSQEEQPEALLPFHGWRRKISFMAKNMDPGVHHFHAKATDDRRPTTDGGHPSSVIRHLSFLALHDTADSWGTAAWAWRDLAGTFETLPGSKMIVEHGPVRTIEQEIRKYGESRIIINRITYAGWPVTEYKIRVHWNEERMRLNVTIPTDMASPRLTAEIPGGADVFAPDGQEHVHGRWMVVTDDGRPTTDVSHRSSVVRLMGIAHNGLHGFDFDGKEIRLSVLRSAAYCHEQGFSLDSGPYHKYMDLGIHDFRLALWEDPSIDPAAIAEWLITPPLVWPHLSIG
ncbi:MAG TPA: hypothetical protein DC042_06190 [Bacteroidales bacterium]|nr:hypothetical protein [Bacteroidales bacterium]